MKTLALDIDGVLHDPLRGGKGHWTQDLHTVFALTPERLHAKFFAPYWEEIVVGRQELRQTLSAVCEAERWEVDADELIEYWMRTDLHLVDHAVRRARELAHAGVRLMLVSNQESTRAQYLQRRLHAELPIWRFVSSSGAGLSKETGEFYRWCISAHDIDVDHVVLLDDSPINVAAARDAGWRAVLHTSLEDDASWAEAERLLGVVAR